MLEEKLIDILLKVSELEMDVETAENKILKMFDKGWRKYPEEKPEKYGKYQVTLLNLMTKEKSVDYRIALNGQFKMGMLKVIAWMPIPTPFEETK